MHSMRFIAAVSALTLSNMSQKNEVGSVCWFCVSCISASFLSVISACSGKKRETSDKVLVFFSENDKKSIVTLYESQIQKIHIVADKGGTRNEGNLMVAVLDKVVIGQGRRCKAERRIAIQDYVHSWEKGANEEGKPQVTLLISGKDHKKQLETCFTPLKDRKNLTLIMKTKKLIERACVPDKPGSTFIEKAITLTIDRRSILVKLLELYTRENSEDNIKKAIFLASRYLHYIPKTILEHLRKRVKKLCRNNGEMQNLILLSNVLNPLYIPYRKTISDEHMLSLKNDIMMLVKERACKYENLHEALSQDAYCSLVSPGLLEVVACYSTKANQPTNSLFRRYIAENKEIAGKMKTIHSFIDICKKHEHVKIEDIIIDEKLLQYFPEGDGKYAYDALRSCVTDHKEGEAVSLSDAVESARKKVASKYSAAFVGDVVGVAEKTTTNASKVSVKMEKVKSPDEPTSCFSIREGGPVILGHGSIQR